MNVAIELLNGVVIEPLSPFSNSVNRAFRYGDGLFETIHIREGKLLFLADHLERLIQGMKILHLEWGLGSFQQVIERHLDEIAGNNHKLNARVRLTVFREGDGYYQPNTEKCSWHLSVLPIPYNKTWPSDFVQSITIWKDQHKMSGSLSSLKTLNGLIYIQASIGAGRHGTDDALILNEHGRITESANSNIFLVKGNHIITPNLSEGCLEGVMRKNVLKLLKNESIPVEEGQITIAELNNADEVFLTNVITGIRPVKKFDSRSYQTSRGEAIAQLLKKMVDSTYFPN
jgi:branched-chain amino acid aminotransferase